MFRVLPASVAQSVARLTANPEVASSNPCSAKNFRRDYGKCPKILKTIPYYLHVCLNFAFYQLHLKIFNGMVKSVDPDQTASV